MTTVTLRLADELARELRRESAQQSISVNQAIVLAVSDWLARQADAQADVEFQAVARERAELLGRLGTA